MKGRAHHNERQREPTRDPADLARQFHLFGRVEAPPLESPMYAELSYGVSQDAELIELAGRTRPGQPPPNMLYAAVQYLLLSGVEHELVVHYPAITGQSRPPAPAFAAFRDFCLLHREAIEALLATRLTQTNVIQRCACLLPAFAHVYEETGQPAALVEVGCSAGLNMNWDRFRYTYLDMNDRQALAWGDPASPVDVSSVLRGENVPRLPDAVPVAWRIGVDLNPIDIEDDDPIRWLRALIWPEHVERHQRLMAAVEVARRHPVEKVRGDAVVRLPELLAHAPADAALVVYATHALYQMSREDRVRLLKSIEAFARAHDRRVDLISMESAEGSGYSLLELHTYGPDGRVTRELGHANPHGRWLRWLLPPDPGND